MTWHTSGRFYIAVFDGRLLSPCCDAPQHVYPGPIKINPNKPGDWEQPIMHQCSKCGKDFDPKQGRSVAGGDR